MATSTADDLLATLASAGWLINNAYQEDTGLWHVNIRRPTPDGDWFTDWAIADTFVEALEECMSKLLDAEFVPSKEVVGFVEPHPLNTSLATALGINRPSVRAPRRV